MFVAAESAVKAAEARGAKVLEEADADRNKLNKAVEELKNWVTIFEEVTARASKDEVRAREVAEVRYGLTTSLNQLKADHDWMRDHGIGHIVGTILDAPENATAVNELKDRARQAGFKSRFTDERSGFHGVDTEALYAAAVDAYNNLSISAVEDIEKCLEAEDYIDRLRLLFDRPEEEDEAAGGVKDDAGTSGIKAD
ncbi:hypothetical protein HanRHA438_Chr15g0706371 [Helianthus annuus]|nr:hypothetical protein HanPSC8_Chr15g0665911 [Helianthus annuus]KAJ0844789.1 hypothetical protein HanRHA438_Chr15g0706371 [Helianthus annuus]